MKKTAKISILVFLMCVSLITSLLFACNNGDSTQPIENNGFLLKQYYFKIYEGDTCSIEIISDKNDEYEFIVSNAEIIKVDKTGIVTGLKEGYSTITVKSDEHSETVMIEVIKDERKIVLDTTNTNKIVGGSFSITAIVYEKGVDAGGIVDWSLSSDCANIIKGNTITLSPASTGYITVTATYCDLTAQCVIKVVNENSVVLDSPSVTVENCNTLIWNAVPNATKYAVLINGGEWKEIEGTSLIIDEVDSLKYNEKLMVAIRAKSDNFDFIDSSYTTLNLRHDFNKSVVGDKTFSCVQAGTVKYICPCGISYIVEDFYDKHNFVDGRCVDCTEIQSPGVIYAYDAENDVYYVAGVQDGFDSEELYALATFNNGKNGEKPVKYVGYKAFSMNTRIKKIVLPESIVGLAGASFYRMHNLEHLEMPGLTYTSETPSYYPDFGEEGKAFAQNARDNFTDTYNLRTIVVGEGFDNNCRNFFIHKWSPDDYKPILDVMVKGTYYDNLFSSSTRLGLIKYSVGAKDGENYQLTGEVYYYDETGEKCGHWWHYDEDGNVVKNKDHTIRENICVECGYVYNKNLMFKWSEALQGYEFMCAREGVDLEEIIIPQTYNDGVHGEAEVIAVGRGAFLRMTNLKKVILPESVKTIDSSFGVCTKLEEVIMPGVTKINGINNFINCIKLNKIVVSNSLEIPYQSFYVEPSKYPNYKATVVAYLTSQDDGTINLTNRWNNNMLAGSVVYYNSNPGDEHGRWWNYDSNGNVVTLLNDHVYNETDGYCSCGEINPYGIVYTYDSATDSYFVSGVDKKNKDTEIKILSQYDNGMNGLKSVTRIGDEAFALNTHITKIILPKSVTSIGQRAFMHCSNLKTLIAPGVVVFEYLGNDTQQTFQFSYCYALEEVVLSTEITSIPDRVFYVDRDVDNDGLLDDANKTDIFLDGDEEKIMSIKSYNDLWTKNVYLYNPNISTGGKHGYWWKWKNDVVNGEIEKIINEHNYTNDICDCGKQNSFGIKYKYDSNTDSYKILYLIDKSLKEVVIPDEYNDGINGTKYVTIVGDSSFRSSNLEKIVLPQTVTSIEAYAFMFSSVLHTVIAPGVFEFINTAQFSYCASLETVVLNEKLTTIPEGSFYNDKDLDNDGEIDHKEKTNIYLSGDKNNIGYIESSRNQLLSNKIYLYSENPTAHGEWWKWTNEVNGEISIVTNEHVFENGKCECGQHTSDIAHEYYEGVCACGNSIVNNVIYSYVEESNGIPAHYVATGLVSVFVDEIYVKGEHTENGITAPVTTIGMRAFVGVPNDSNQNAGNHYNKLIKKVVLHENVKIISAYGFMNCRELEIVIAPGVEEVGESAFAYDYNLRTLVLGEVSILPNGFLFNDKPNGAVITKVTDVFVYTSPDITVSVVSGAQQLLKNIYYYNKNGAIDGIKCWNYDVNGNIVKYE